MAAKAPAAPPAAAAAAKKWQAPPAPPTMMLKDVQDYASLVKSLKKATHDFSVPHIIVDYEARRVELADAKIVLVPTADAQRTVDVACFVIVSYWRDRRCARLWGAIRKDKLLKCKLDDDGISHKCFPNMFMADVPAFMIPLPPPPPAPPQEVKRLISATAPTPTPPRKPVPIWNVYAEPPLTTVTLSIIYESITMRIEWFDFVERARSKLKPGEWAWWETTEPVPTSIYLYTKEEQLKDQISFWLFNYTVKAVGERGNIAKRLQDLEDMVFTFRMRVIQPHCIDDIKWIHEFLRLATGKHYEDDIIHKLHIAPAIHTEWTGRRDDVVWSVRWEYAGTYVAKRKVVMERGRAYLTHHQLVGVIIRVYKKQFLYRIREDNLCNRIAYTTVDVRLRRDISRCFSRLRAEFNGVSEAKIGPYGLPAKNSVNDLGILEPLMPHCIGKLHASSVVVPENRRWILFRWYRKMGADEPAVHKSLMPKYSKAYRERGLPVDQKIKELGREIKFAMTSGSQSAMRSPPTCLGMTMLEGGCPFIRSRTPEGAIAAFAECSANLTHRRGTGTGLPPAQVGEYSSPLAFGLELFKARNAAAAAVAVAATATATAAKPRVTIAIE
jgi:hypothetical protein